jgi:hypothetical protein
VPDSIKEGGVVEGDVVLLKDEWLGRGARAFIIEEVASSKVKWLC